MNICFTQKLTCKVKTVKSFNKKSFNNWVLTSIYHYRFDNQLSKIEHLNDFGVVINSLNYEYDTLNRCYLSYKEEGGIYSDSLLAIFNSKGEMYQIRQLTYRDFNLKDSKFKKVKKNECGEIIMMKTFQPPYRFAVVSKKKYEYEYWN